MKTNRIILFVCSLEVLVSAFVNIPYLSTSLFRIIALIVAYAMIKLSAYLWERKIEKYQTEIIVDGIQVYKLPYKLFKSHNVMVFKGKKYNIVVEDEVMNSLDSEELKAVLYHEVGHTHTVSKELIIAISLVALFFNSQGLFDSIYNDTGAIYLLIGICLFILSELLKRYIEYSADKYAINCGCNKETLISSIEKIEKLNSNSKIVISAHPRTDKRYRNLGKSIRK